MTVPAMTCEHPYDVLQKLSAWQAVAKMCALVIITETEGGAVRAPGALLAVSADEAHGYISGGCIDADVILQARQAMSSRKPRALRYGAGSPFVDLPLPCGGAINITICPDPDPVIVKHLTNDLRDRRKTVLFLTQAGDLAISPNRKDPQQRLYRFEYHPPIRLRIAGRGADALALATIAQAAGYDTRLQLLDEKDIENARRHLLSDVQILSTVSSLPDAEDDPWTAFVLLFHDRELETPLLIQALAGPAFYIGAVGSRHTHAKRCDELRSAGCDDEEFDRIHGPIGLVPSLRDASTIALSTLAEIIAVAKRIPKRQDYRTGFIMLAAGASNRFESGDKLLADLAGQSVLSRSSNSLVEQAPGSAVAVVAPNDARRTEILQQAGWDIIINPAANDGQATSITCAMAHLQAQPNIDQVIILLGDMPCVPSSHISELLEQASMASCSAIMSDNGENLSPPALFKRKWFKVLSEISGDRGAKSVYQEIAVDKTTIKLAADAGLDIDFVADLTRAMESEDA